MTFFPPGLMLWFEAPAQRWIEVGRAGDFTVFLRSKGKHSTHYYSVWMLSFIKYKSNQVTPPLKPTGGLPISLITKDKVPAVTYKALYDLTPSLFLCPPLLLLCLVQTTPGTVPDWSCLGAFALALFSAWMLFSQIQHDQFPYFLIFLLRSLLLMRP